MTDPAHAERHGSACENCGAWLQGGFCHLCGQSAHNPLRHFGHAVEEVFESFWHLDGRVFRTLRDLFVPGRVARAYLAGHRVRYIAPLRMFVIVTALTVFVAKVLLAPAIERNDSDAPAQGAAALAEAASAEGPAPAPVAPARPAGIDSAFASADSTEDVERVRTRLLRDLAEAEALPALGFALREARRRIDDAADARVVALGGAPPARDADADAARDAAASSAADDDDRAAHATGLSPWDGHPFLARIGHRIERFEGDGQAFVRFMLGAAPPTLFVLVPLFALMLKIMYVFQRRSYLEHVVVALYSHVYLMLALLLIFASVAIRGWMAARAPWLGSLLSMLEVALICSMPLYLLWMQRNVYQQGWLMTLVKYLVIGQVYAALFLIVALGVMGFSLFAL